MLALAVKDLRGRSRKRARSGFESLNSDLGDDEGIGTDMPGVRSQLFWRGVLQGFSGPAMLSAQPRILDEFVDVTNGRIHLKLPEHRGTAAAGSRRDTTDLVRALADAVATIVRERGLKLGTEIAQLLARPGTGRDRLEPTTPKRADNGSR